MSEVAGRSHGVRRIRHVCKKKFIPLPRAPRGPPPYLHTDRNYAGRACLDTAQTSYRLTLWILVKRHMVPHPHTGDVRCTHHRARGSHVAGGGACIGLPTGGVAPLHTSRPPREPWASLITRHPAPNLPAGPAPSRVLRNHLLYAGGLRLRSAPGPLIFVVSFARFCIVSLDSSSDLVALVVQPLEALRYKAILVAQPLPSAPYV